VREADQFVFGTDDRVRVTDPTRAPFRFVVAFDAGRGFFGITGGATTVIVAPLSGENDCLWRRLPFWL
jgi:V8-like Glu-specific endopeptidase